MLSKKICEKTIEKELYQCFIELERISVNVVAIACNTLHAFLEAVPQSIELIHMIEETKKYLKKRTVNAPLVLCSTTSANKKLHRQYFTCEYANRNFQEMLDKMISKITHGEELSSLSRELSINLPNKPILLGCTEFSYLHARYPINAEKVYDPNIIVAERLAEIFF